MRKFKSLRTRWQHHGINVGAWTLALLDTILLVCTECGYLEFYVEDETELAKLRDKFGKVE